MTIGPYQLYLIAFAVCCAVICAYAGFKLGQMIQRWAIIRRRLDESKLRTVRLNQGSSSQLEARLITMEE